MSWILPLLGELCAIALVLAAVSESDPRAIGRRALGNLGWIALATCVVGGLVVIAQDPWVVLPR